MKALILLLLIVAYAHAELQEAVIAVKTVSTGFVPIDTEGDIQQYEYRKIVTTYYGDIPQSYQVINVTVFFYKSADNYCDWFETESIAEENQTIEINTL